MPANQRDDPYLNFNFRVEIDGIAIAGFSEADIGGGRIDVVVYREGTDTGSADRLLPGRVTYDPVVLRRGVTGEPALFRWWHEVVQGHVERRNVTIVLMDERRNDVERWVLRRAWPTKWTGPALNGRGNDVAIEELHLVHEGIELDD